MENSRALSKPQITSIRSFAPYIALVLLCIVPWFLRSQVFVLHLFNIIYHNIIIVIGLVIILGFSKQFSLGQVAFYGIGAYSTALLTRDVGLNFFPALILAGLVAATISLGIAAICDRFKGPWLALVTFSFAEIARILFSRFRGLTGGFAGFFNIPKPSIGGFRFSNEFTYYFIFAVFAVFAATFALKIKRTIVGRRWMAVGDNDNISMSIGINPFVQKLVAFALGSFIAGVAGGLFAGYANYLSPEMFKIDHTLFYLTILVVGGLESVPGGIISAILFTLFQDMLRGLYPWDMVVYGLIIIVFINVAPQGIGELLRDLLSWVRSKVSAGIQRGRQ